MFLHFAATAENQTTFNTMIAKRIEEITPFLVMDVLERARAMERDGINVIHLEVGEPDFDVP